MASNFKKQWEYSGDVNMLDYGGKFIRHVGGRRYHVVELTNMDEACGRDNQGRDRYVVELSEVDLDTADVQAAYSSCGPGKDIADIADIWLAEMVHGYGQKAPLGSWEGDNGHRLLREAKAESKRLEANTAAYEVKMSQPVNALGSTARKFQHGDITAALSRKVEKGDPAGRLLAKMQSRPLKGVAMQVDLGYIQRQGISSDPIAYVAGFQDGLTDEDLPNRKAVAKAYLAGRAVGIDVRLGRSEVPIWVKGLREA